MAKDRQSVIKTNGNGRIQVLLTTPVSSNPPRNVHPTPSHTSTGRYPAPSTLRGIDRAGPACTIGTEGRAKEESQHAQPEKNPILRFLPLAYARAAPGVTFAGRPATSSAMPAPEGHSSRRTHARPSRAEQRAAKRVTGCPSFAARPRARDGNAPPTAKAYIPCLAVSATAFSPADCRPMAFESNGTGRVDSSPVSLSLPAARRAPLRATVRGWRGRGCAAS